MGVNHVEQTFLRCGKWKEVSTGSTGALSKLGTGCLIAIYKKLYIQSLLSTWEVLCLILPCSIALSY